MRFNIVEGEPGDHLLKCINRSIARAKELDSTVVMKFNDTEVHVYPESYAHDIGDKYWLLRKIECGA